MLKRSTDLVEADRVALGGDVLGGYPRAFTTGIASQEPIVGEKPGIRLQSDRVDAERLGREVPRWDHGEPREEAEGGRGWSQWWWHATISHLSCK